MTNEMIYKAISMVIQHELPQSFLKWRSDGVLEDVILVYDHERKVVYADQYVPILITSIIRFFGYKVIKLK